MRKLLLLCSLLTLCVMAALADGDKVARISFDQESHTFGTMSRRGGEVSYDFVFTNEGTAPLVIKKVTKNCICTSVKFSKRPVMPGESASITVTYAPSKLPAGTFHKAIKVFTNDPRTVTILTIHGQTID